MTFSKFLKLIVAAPLVLTLIPGCSFSEKAENRTYKSFDDVFIYPVPQNILLDMTQIYTLSDGGVVFDADFPQFTADKIIADVKEYANVTLKSNGKNAVISFAKNTSLHEQGYSLTINETGITVEYKDDKSALYSIVTLKQLLFQRQSALPYVTVTDDHPDLLGRMFFLDVARNRIPSMNTLKQLIDDMVDMKMNQFEMYMEGQPFQYATYPDTWKYNLGAYSPEDIQELDAYCKERMIDLIPNQNTYGHMYKWSAVKSLKNIRELLYLSSSDSINLFHPETVEFLKSNFDDLLPNYSSEYFHINCDEPHTTGTGQSKLAPQNADLLKDLESDNSHLVAFAKCKIYLRSVKIIYDLVIDRSFIPIIAGDIITNYANEQKHPGFSEYIIDFIKTEMPELTIANWMYMKGDPDFWETFNGIFNDNQIPYFVQPASWAWGTIIGRTSFAEQNIEESIYSGIKHGALGVMMSDFGDWGNANNLTASYYGFTYAAGLAWCYDNNIKSSFDYNKFLSRMIYQDTADEISQKFTTLADYNEKFTQSWGTSWVVGLMQERHSELSNINLFISRTEGESQAESIANAINQFEQTKTDCEEFMLTLQNSNLLSDHGALIKREMYSGAWFVKVGCDYAIMRLSLYGDEPLKTKSELLEKAAFNFEEYNAFIKDFTEVWLLRNGYSGLDDTLNLIHTPIFLYTEINPDLIPKNGENLCLLNIKDLPVLNSENAIDYITNGWSWISYGNGMPKLNTGSMDFDSYTAIKSSIENKIYYTVEKMDGAEGSVLVYNRKRSIDTGISSTWGSPESNPDGTGQIPAFIGLPFYFPENGTYKITAQLKRSSGMTPEGFITMSGSFSKPEGGLADASCTNIDVVGPDKNGWYTVSGFIRNSYNAHGASIVIRLSSDQIDDELFIADVSMIQS